MKAFIASLVLPLLVAAAPISEATQKSSPPFTVVAARCGSPIHFLQMNAANERFWLGGETASFCPSDVVPQCPPGNKTVLAANGNALDVEVPGGQQVYVGHLGALRFTQAHSAFIPPGSDVGGMIYQHGTPFNHLTFKGFGAEGLMACPTKTPRWQVFAAMHNATVPLGNVNDCLRFDALAITYTGPVPAWQYV